jgi:alpha-tubulin suppressor-like RCC1 family protein
MIAAGEYHSLALKRDGSLWCWGWNTFGQLGMGNTRDRRHPSRVGLDEDWSFVSAGDHHSLGVRTGGALWGWGYNGYGQLGDGTAEDRDIPVLIRPPREKRSYFGIPLPAR